jgi:hypothetical protein
MFATNRSTGEEPVINMTEAVWLRLNATLSYGCTTKYGPKMHQHLERNPQLLTDFLKSFPIDGKRKVRSFTQ